MDLDRFCQTLPSFYDGWGQAGCQPRSGQFAEVLASICGMTTPSICQLLNHAVGCLEAGEVYAEVGSFQGATLVSALLGHPHTFAEAVDNFSEFDPQGANQRLLQHNVARFCLHPQVHFFSQDFERYFVERRQRRAPPIGVYLYDGSHDYRSQLLGLLLAAPHLAERALIIVDDANWPAVRQATWDFLAACTGARLLLEVRTPENGTPDFWNGLQVLTWQSGTDNGYSADALARHREITLLHRLAEMPQTSSGGTSHA